MNIVSIIVPMYNAERFINRTLDSIINQSYKDIEIIVVDDGSTDNSNEIVKRYEKNDNRVHLYKKENGGLSSARNEGLRYSSGQLVMFIDSDDYIDSTMVERLVNNLEIENADLAVSGLYLDYENDQLITVATKKCVVKNKIILDRKELITHEALVLKKDGMIDSCCNKIYKKSIIDANRLEMPLGEMFEDTEFNFQYLCHVNKIVVLNECFYHYMQRNTNRITNTYNIKKFNYLCKRVRTMKKFVDEFGTKDDLFYVCYWYVRYAYSTLMDLINNKEDIRILIKNVYSDSLFIELSKVDLKFPNLFYRIYVNSFLKKRTFQVVLITKISNYLKKKRNSKS